MNRIQILFFSTDSCAPCHSLLPKIEEIIKHCSIDIEFEKVTIEEQPDLAAQYMIFSAPTLLFLVNNQEHSRLAGIFSIREAEKILQRIQQMF